MFAGEGKPQDNSQVVMESETISIQDVVFNESEEKTFEAGSLLILQKGKYQVKQTGEIFNPEKVLYVSKKECSISFEEQSHGYLLKVGKWFYNIYHEQNTEWLQQNQIHNEAPKYQGDDKAGQHVRRVQEPEWVASESEHDDVLDCGGLVVQGEVLQGADDGVMEPHSPPDPQISEPGEPTADRSHQNLHALG